MRTAELAKIEIHGSRSGKDIPQLGTVPGNATIRQSPLAFPEIPNNNHNNNIQNDGNSKIEQRHGYADFRLWRISRKAGRV